MAAKRILLVDYDPKSLSYTRNLLQGAGFEVSTCGDGLAAIDQFKSQIPDLVLLSAMLPKMHGFEVCSNIRKLPGGESTPVVIITDVYKGKRYRTDAIQKYGATEYIEKPIDDSNLVSILQGLVQSNGASAEAPVEEKTMQISRDALMGKMGEDPGLTIKPAVEKKAVSDKPKAKDDISKKLEQSLAGLDLSASGKARPKPKPAATGEHKIPVPPAAAASSTATVVIRKGEDGPGVGFTSEDLFTDVIASVERELQSEKLITKSGVEEAAATIIEEPASPPTVAFTVPPQPAAAMPPTPAPAPAKPAAPQPPKPAPAGSGFAGSDMEKKLSNTLSGIMKEKPAGASKPAPAAAPKHAEPARPAAAAKAPEAPKPAPEPAAAPATMMITRDKMQEAIATVPEEGINFGQYLLLSKIATGGMAELFKAKRKGVEGFEKILAIKRILPHMSDNEEFITMFIDEAKLAAQLSHHNICQIFDLGKIENAYYIAMEYVHGKDLRALLKAARTKNKTIPVELAVLITSKICSALDYAHRKRDNSGQQINLVHRDVSPQNILISYEGDVKLVDFGIAKAATKVHVTQHGALKGKLLYMSPEQAWGRSVDKRSDIFSVGVVLYEMLTGRPLFFDDNDTEVTILEKVREARIVPIRDINSKVSAELEKIILKALNKNPDQRYQVASEMQKDLDNLFYTEGFNATSASLASFARSLFPEEWGQESGSKDTVMIDKDASEAMKAALPAAAAAAAAAAAPAKPEPAPPPPPPRPAPQAAAPAPKHSPAPEPQPQQTVKATADSFKQPAAAAKHPEPVNPAGFRDISMPDMFPADAEKSNTMKIVIGIVALVIAVGVIAFFLFRSPSQPAATGTETPTNTQPAPKNPPPSSTTTTTTTTPSEAPSTTTPTTTTPPTTTPPTTEPNQADKMKVELEKKIEEERLKLEKIQKDDAAKKAEEDRKKAELAKLQEQQKAEQQKPPEPEPEPEPAPVQEQPKVEVAPVTPEPKPEPVQPPPQAEPAGPVVNEGDLVELTPDVMKPTIVTRVEPSYPPIARSKKVEGTVILSVLVSEGGSVADVKVLRGAGGSMGLNEAAVAAVKKWKFRPAVKAGKRVKVWVTYPVVFKVQ